MTTSYYFSLSEYVDGLWPHALLEPPGLDDLARIWLEPLRFSESEDLIHTAVLIEGSLEIGIPGLDMVSLVLAPDNTETVFMIEITTLPVPAGRLVDVPIAVRIRSDWLRPARQLPLPSGQLRYEVDPDREFMDITLGTVELSLSATGAVSLVPQQSVSLPPAMLGNTGVAIGADNIEFNFDLNNPQLFIGAAFIALPPDFVLPPDTKITLENGFINGQGFSGSVGIDLPLSYDAAAKTFGYPTTGSGFEPAELFGISGGLSHVGISFAANRLIDSDIWGALLVPYFDEPVDVRIGVTDHGDFAVSLLAADPNGIELRKEELLALTLKSLAVAKEADTVSLRISGGLQPLLMASDGLQWPRLDVTDLYLDSDGKFRISAAWLELEELASLDLWGFQLELSRIGLGYIEPSDKLWIDLSGSIRLIEQIPVGLGVEGFRITWPRDPGLPSAPSLDDILALAPQIGVEFDGIYLFYGVPDAVEFEGLIRFMKTDQIVGFAGDVALRVPASGFAAEAGLMVGMNFEAPAYPFLYVYFGVELPAGVPLGQSGLALKGALGLFGMNVTPDKAPEQNWYYDWYKRGPIVGAHPTNKWRPERSALSLGVGVTITTVDGYIKGTRGLLVLALPGPILIIEGRALILDVLPNSEPPLRAMAVFDGQAQIAQFNIEAEAELVPDFLRAYGMLEAFFDFQDLTNWHLYLGQDEPADRRIQANIFKVNSNFLFDANAYLMVDMVGAHTVRSRMGFQIGFAPPLPELPPLELTMDATLEGSGQVTILPEQLSGDVLLSANASIAAFDFGVQIAVTGQVLTEGPDPFKVEADLTLEAELPWPLDPFEAQIHFAWESPRAPEIEAPVAGAVADSDFVRGGGALALLGGQRADPLDAPETEQPALDSPTVALDARPTIIFGHDMNVGPTISDVSGGNFAGHPGSTATPHSYDVGRLQITPSLIVSGVRLTPTVTGVELLKHPKTDPWNGDDTDWTSVATTAPDAPDAERFWGTWLAEATPDNPTTPAVRRLRLWTASPFDHARGALGSGYQRILDLAGPRSTYVEEFLESYADFFDCSSTAAVPTCVDFRGVDAPKPPAGTTWVHRQLTLTVEGSLELSEMPPIGTAPPDVCLEAQGRLHIRFPDPVRIVQISFCTETGVSATDVASVIAVGRPPRTIDERAEVERAARAKSLPPDYRACAVPVPFEVDAGPREWTITAAEGFECLELRQAKYALKQICYKSQAELERSTAAAAQCSTNDTVLPGFWNQPVLAAASYYRLIVHTELGVDVLPGVDTDDNPFVPLLEDLYQASVADLPDGPISYVQEAYFQTDLPPATLMPYVAWTDPDHQAVDVFRENDLTVRFRRPYLHAMYSDDSPSRLRMEIQDVAGRIVPGYETVWSSARSATLLPDERRWLEHVGQDPDDPDGPWPPDATLEARRLLLLSEDFQDPALPRWTAVDDAQGPPRSDWRVIDGELRQLSLIHGGRAEHDAIEKPGTYQLAGHADWPDMAISCTLRSSRGGTIGLMFRYRDRFNYYRFSMDDSGSYRRLVKFRNGTPILLHEERAGFDVNQPHELEIRCVNDSSGVVRIEVEMDGYPWPTVLDDSPPVRGSSIGLYCWRNPHAAFSAVHVIDADVEPLQPDSRYKVRVVSQDVVLHETSFTTSTFNRFRDVVRSFGGPPTALSVSSPSPDLITGNLGTSVALARATRDWEAAGVEFRDQMLDGGRAGLEALRQVLRNARAENDETFRALCDDIFGGGTIDAYQPLAPVLQIYVLRSACTAVGLWLRSPRGLNLRLAVPADDSADGSTGHTQVGRTSLEFLRSQANTAWQPQALRMAHNTDGTQILLFPAEGSAAWPIGNYRLTFTYHRNHGDEEQILDHRHDRPVERRLGSDTPEIVHLDLNLE